MYKRQAYYDVTGGERGNNYFGSIKAGETKILHVGFVVDEDALPYLYLNTGTSGSSYTFTEQDLEQGLVDICLLYTSMQDLCIQSQKIMERSMMQFALAVVRKRKQME